MLVKCIVNLHYGARLSQFFTAKTRLVRTADAAPVLHVFEAAVFTNWLPLRRQIQALAAEPRLQLDLSRTCLVDHTVMRKLQELSQDWASEQRELQICGLAAHRGLSAHPQATQVLRTA
jgi:hypothetical protein